MQKDKIVHIFNDDKFIDSAIELFESTHPDCSDYYVLKNKTEKFVYIKSDKVLTLDYSNKNELELFIKNINTNNNIVFFHALDKIKQEITLQLRPKIKKVWFIWGYDLYKIWPLYKVKIYDHHTKIYLNKFFSIKKFFLNTSFAFWCFKNANPFLPKKIADVISNHFNTPFYKAVNLMDIVVPVIPTEFELAKKINSNLILAPFTYGYLEDILGVNFDKNVSKSKNILVGNSGDISNNHLDIFIKLSKLNLKDKKVFVPLSYGGSVDYIDYIIKKGEELLGSNFFPITSFMSRKEYNEILLSCDTLIFNHIRQQGVGNIITLGYLGAKIYLNKKSPVFEFYKNEKITLFEVNELTNKSLDYKLTESDLIQNRQLFLKLYSKQSVNIKVNQLFTILNNIKK